MFATINNSIMTEQVSNHITPGTLKKSDLYASLWASCDQLRGGMDASQYKDYILTLLFVKYVSDKAKTDPDSLINVPTGGSFDDMLSAKGDKEIGDRFNKIIGILAEANGLRTVIDQADFNDEEKLGKGKEMQDRLSKLVTIFNDLDFRGSRSDGDDLLGDAYEYLMRHFATESGKSKGQFYTPAEVSRILAKVVGIGPNTRKDHTVYDPACGSGSLLLKAAAEAPRGMTIYGQEKDNATWALSRMNMILHGNEIADIAKGDTITNPQFTNGTQLRTFDYVVMNPPFSIKSWSNGLENDYDRFEYGRPPEKNGDFAFLLHALKSLKSTGKGAVILPHGVLFRGNAEGSIRTRLLKQGFIKGVIGLPANLFYGTGIPACIIIFDKENASDRKAIFMIDASKGFIKDGNKNRLRNQDIHKIVDTFNKEIEIDRYSRMVPISEIADPKNDYNLNIPRFIDSSEPEDLQDLEAHLRGGIPDHDLDILADYWRAFPQLRAQLFSSNRTGYSNLSVEVADVQKTIINSSEFQKFTDESRSIVSKWFTDHSLSLEAIDSNTKPGELITALGDDLLALFKPIALLDEYTIYEQLMTYWNDIMHDDVGMIINKGWTGAAKPRTTIDDKERKLSETPDLIIGSGKKIQKYKMDLVPPKLIVNKFFRNHQSVIDEISANVELAITTTTEHAEENGGDEGILSSATNEKNLYTKQLLSTTIKSAKASNDLETLACASEALKLFDKEVEVKKALKAAQSELDLAVLLKYDDLTTGDIQKIVLEDKWKATIIRRVINEVNALTLDLVERIRQLGVRYAETVDDIETTYNKNENKVIDHLLAMGFKK